MNSASYGNSKQALEIANLFSVLLHNEEYRLSIPVEMHWILDSTGHIKDIDKFADNLKNKIRSYCGSLIHPRPVCEVIQKILIAHVQYRKLINNPIATYSANDLVQVMRAVEPFKDEKFGHELYMQVAKQLALYYVRDDQYGKAQKLADGMQEVYDDYKKSGKPEPLTFFDLLHVDSSASGYALDLEDMYYEIGFVTWEAYETSKNIDKLSSIAVRAISYSFLWPASENYAMSMPVLNKLSSMLKIILLKRRYKQLDHAIAYVMTYIIQFRRALPEQERHAVNCAQGKLASVFTEWGIDLLESAIQKLTDNGNSKPIDNETFEQVKDLTEKLDGTDIYTGQFPIEPIKSEAKFKHVLNRAKKWNQRALELSNSKGPEVYAEIYNRHQYKENYAQALADKQRLTALEEKFKKIDLQKFKEIQA